MSQPRILILAPRRPGEGLGGAEQHLADLALLLRNLGAEVNFVSIDDAERAGAIGRFVERVLPLMRSPLAAARLRASQPILRADLLITVELLGVGLRHSRHLHLFFGSYACFRRAALQPVKGLKAVHRAMTDVLARYLERKTQGSLGALANSAGLKEGLSRLGIPTREEVIPPPTDTNRFRSGSMAEARAALGLPADVRLLLFAGRWEYAKGADRVVEIVNAMPEDWRLVLACPSSATWPWPERNRVHLLHDLPNTRMPLVYQAADVLIQPSRFEGYSLVVSEAQSCGCPVVTSDVGHAAHLLSSSSELVRRGVIGAPDSSRTWIDAIETLIGSADAQRRASIAAREFAEATVSHSVVGRQWAELLEKILPEYKWFPR